MEEDVYRVAEYPNQEKGFFMDEQKFAKFSKNLFKIPVFGYICGILLNIVYLNSWRKKKSILSIIMTLFVDYLIIQIILKKLLKSDEAL